MAPKRCDMWRRLALVSICCLLGAVCWGCNRSVETPLYASGRFPRYNILLVGFDALRPDHTTIYGGPRDTTPNLGALARQSYIFSHAYDVASWTLPSFMSVFTAVYPTINGVTNKWMLDASGKMVETRLKAEVTTLPQMLKAQGYQLAAFTGDAGVSSKFGFGRDFDTYLDDVHFGGMDHSIPAALDWLEKHGDRPFFMFLHGYDVHGQYDPPGGYRRLYASDYRGPLKGNKDEDATFREAGLQPCLRPEALGEPRLSGMDAAGAKFYADLYDEKVHDADERFGKFLDAFKKMGLYDKTIIICISDHGDEFLEHSTIDHGQTLYDELCHVVALIHFPGQQQQVVISEKIPLIDILPTALDSVGVPLTRPVNGASLLPILGGAHPTRNLYAETDYRLFVHKRSVRDDRYKFILNLQSGRRELYDLQQDPGEQHDLHDANPRQAYEMEQDLLRWLKSMRSPIESYRNRQEDYIKEF